MRTNPRRGPNDGIALHIPGHLCLRALDPVLACNNLARLFPFCQPGVFHTTEAGMTWLALYAAILTRLSDLASRVRALAAPITGASGLAQRTGQTRNADAITTSARELIAHEARQARRQHRPVKPIYSRARAITHGILARGVK